MLETVAITRRSQKHVQGTLWAARQIQSTLNWMSCQRPIIKRLGFYETRGQFPCRSLTMWVISRRNEAHPYPYKEA